MKVYNFSAGPSVLPEAVLQRAQNELLNYNSTGMSIVEMSHRTKAFDEVIQRTESLLRELMQIPDDYYVLFLQGGASTQFDAIPLNLLKTGKADYVVTGNFASKAAQAASRYGDIKIAASSKQDNYTYIPDLSGDIFRPDADYIHITSNNTIFGSRITKGKIPTTVAPLVCDCSSHILGEEIEVSKYGMLYAGAQKNIAPAGLTIVIIKKDMTTYPMDICPIMLKYSTHAENGSMYNTPPCFPIYMAMLNLEWLKEFGGIKAMEQQNIYKASLLYDYIDSTDFYKNNIKPEDRSIMNVPFVTGSAELDAQFVKEAGANGFVSIKGHRVVGGMRASIYNGMPVEGVKALVEFMKDFEMRNK